MAKSFGISCLEEAEEYLQHPVLGPRLRECTKLVYRVEGRTILQILHSPDNLKFRSCMTLFSFAADSLRRKEIERESESGKGEEDERKENGANVQAGEGERVSDKEKFERDKDLFDASIAKYYGKVEYCQRTVNKLEMETYRK